MKSYCNGACQEIPDFLSVSGSVFPVKEVNYPFFDTQIAFPLRIE